jgi:hypothetical protein
MVSEFRAVLRDPDAGFGIRSVVIDALRLGTPLPEMIPDLMEVLGREASPYAERLHAMLALLRLGDDGKASLIMAFEAGLGRTVNSLRLRSEIIQILYGKPFGHGDVIGIINDTLEAEDTISTGLFWTLPDSVPVKDLPDILDGINLPKRDEGGYDRRSWEVGSFYARILVRAWRTLAKDIVGCNRCR